MTVMEVPIRGMDCQECTLHVQKAIAAVARGTIGRRISGQ